MMSLLAGIILILAACQPKSEPIHFGEDQCHYCKMTISDVKFGSEMITKKGKVYKYDAAECMARHIAEEDPAWNALYAIAYDKPETLLPVDSLHWLISPDFRSPMGANLVAFSKRSQLDSQYHSQLIHWDEVVQRIGE